VRRRGVEGGAELAGQGIALGAARLFEAVEKCGGCGVMGASFRDIPRVQGERSV